MGDLSLWTTEREIGFLNNMGRIKNNGTRERCLRGYLESAQMRKCWAQIDRETVIRHCEKLIEKECGGCNEREK